MLIHRALVVAALVAQALPVTRLDGVQRDVRVRGEHIEQDPLAPLPVTRLAPEPGADLDGPRRVSLTVPRAMDLQDLLLLLVNGTPLSIVTDQSVSGTFVGDLKDLSMRQAIEAVLFPRGLDYDIQGTLIRVFPRKTSTRLFDVNHVNVRRSWQRVVRSGMSMDQRQSSAAGGLSGGVESDPMEELTKGVQSLLSESGRMHLDRAAGILQVTDFSERIDRVAVYVEAVQLRAMRQVRLDARVLEVALNTGVASIDWKAVGARSGPQPMSVGATAGLAVGIDAMQKAIAEQGTITVIAAPRVLALNNEPAVMRVGTQSVSFERASSIAQDGSRERESRAVSVLEGLMLTVIAQVGADGIVQLHVSPSFAARQSEVKSPEGTTFPVLRISEADTIARVRNGETVVLSGFLDDRQTTRRNQGIAGVLGAQTHVTMKTELVILLTPTIVNPGAPSID